MNRREVVRTTPMFIVVREFDDKRHADQNSRGAFVRLQPGKIPEIVLDGLANPRDQQAGELRCERELQDQLYTAQVQSNSDLHHDSQRREIIRATPSYVVARLEDVELHHRLDRDPALRGGYLIKKPGRLPEIVLDSLATVLQQEAAERRLIAIIEGQQSLDRLENLVRTPRGGHPKVRAGFQTGSSPIGQRLVASGLVTEAQLSAALRRQALLPDEGVAARRVGSLLVEDGALTLTQLARALGQQRGLPAVSTAMCRMDVTLRQIFPRAAMLELQAAPLFVVGQRLSVAMADPQDEDAVHLLQQGTKLQIHPLQAPQLQVLRLIESAHG